ncbi:hypothetical protein DAI22_07g281550 [Oryza sativa Japonica Group]|nr:hypothetical protein DAI22_07g281550 [Oryza sativa Japonica Group]
MSSSLSLSYSSYYSYYILLLLPLPSSALPPLARRLLSSLIPLLHSSDMRALPSPLPPPSNPKTQQVSDEVGFWGKRGVGIAEGEAAKITLLCGFTKRRANPGGATAGSMGGCLGAGSYL